MKNVATVIFDRYNKNVNFNRRKKLNELENGLIDN